MALEFQELVEQVNREWIVAHHERQRNRPKRC
jgi:hypothetical protein